MEGLIICISPRSHWAIPHLPALRSLSIDFEDACDASVVFDLGKLPLFSSLELEWYDGADLTVLGQSRTLQKVTVGFSRIELNFFQNLGRTIEEVDISGTFIESGQHPRVQLPHLKSLTLYDSINFLPFLFPINSSSLEEVSITTDSRDRLLGNLLDLLNLQRDSIADFTKHDGSLATFASRVTQLVESLEWPVRADLWEDDSEDEALSEEALSEG